MLNLASPSFRIKSHKFLLFLRLFTVYLFVWVSICLTESSSDASQTVLMLNNRSYSLDDLDREFKARPNIAKIIKRNPKIINKLRAVYLDQLIDRELLIEYGEQKGLVNYKSLTNFKDSFLKKMGGEQSASVRLKSFGINIDDYLSTTVNDLKLAQIADKLTEAVSSVSSNTVEEKMKDLSGALNDPDRVKVAAIILNQDPASWPSGMTPQSIVDELKKSPNKFYDFARKYSNGESKINGGSIGYIFRGALDSKVNHILFNLKKGEISAPVEFGKQIYIFKVEDKKGKELNQEQKKNLLSKHLLITDKKKMVKEKILELRKATNIKTFKVWENKN